MPLRSYADTGDDFANELSALGVSNTTINRMFEEILAYTRTLSKQEMQERARLVRRIRKTGK